MNNKCEFGGEWNMLDAAATHSQFAGVLGGFIFAAIIMLIAERNERARESRISALMLFPPALLTLLISSFLFSVVAGDQSCNRGYTAGILAATLLGVGALSLFSGIFWLLKAYGESNPGLINTSTTVTLVAYFVVIAHVSVSIFDALWNMYYELHQSVPAGWIVGSLAYPLGLLIVMLWLKFKRPINPEKQQRSMELSVYWALAFVVASVVAYAFITTSAPQRWESGLWKWEVYTTLGMVAFFPAIALIFNVRALPPVEPRGSKQTFSEQVRD